MTPTQEAVNKAVQCSDLLMRDIREAHKLSCQKNPLLEIALRELIGDAVKIKNRLAELENCMR